MGAFSASSIGRGDAWPSARFLVLTGQSIQSSAMEINGISAIVTGGASGLGEATCRELGTALVDLVK